MREILITSSVLILAVLVLRRLFWHSLSRRAQYALWGLVLLRLLLPVNLPAVDFSVLTAARPVGQAVETQLAERGFYGPAAEADGLQRPAQPDRTQHGETAPAVPGAEAADPAPARWRGPSLAQVLGWIWYAGMAVTAAVFLRSNLRFWRRLRKYRTPYAAEGFCRPVYLTGEGVLPSPCLFGLFRPAVYLTPAALASEDTLRHVLAHEDAHARRLDPLWSLLRCVCLTVYWFDPLVWIAASVSRTDCELACDESVLARLGEAERIPYGQTLCTLIAVGRERTGLMLAATTMTAGKRQIKDRISRIARRPRRLLAGTLAATLLAAALAACTFTGGTPAGDRDTGPAALTGQELRWFNESFFNDAGAPAGSGNCNIRNQFASPGILYDRPEEIDLDALLYLEGSAPTDEELRRCLGVDPEELPCPAYKLTTADIDAILTEHTGITLAQADGDSLSFTYSGADDAYYWMHGDTNYPGRLFFSCGTRETAGEEELVKLYQSSGYAGHSWYCVTLSHREDGSYWFVSNRACEAPAIPTPLPEGEPLAVIPLTDLPLRVPETVHLTPRPAGDFGGDYHDRLANWSIDGRIIQIYRAADGQIYAAVVGEGDARQAFLSGLSEDCAMSWFGELFGREAFYVSYHGEYKEGVSGPIYDFYSFAGAGSLVLLARCHAGFDTPRIIDLDGDGAGELACGKQIFFQRDGGFCEARLDELLTSACPELSDWDGCRWDVYGKSCVASGLSADAGAAFWWNRYLCFDGENILVYRDERATVDHMAEGAGDGVPAEAVQAARDYAESLLEPRSGGWIEAAVKDDPDLSYFIDDWRIESFTGSSLDVAGDVTIAGWAFNYEFHTTQPERVVWAGGRYVTEDGWVSPGYPGCDWVFFRVEDGQYTYLQHAMLNGMSAGSEAWKRWIEELAAR